MLSAALFLPLLRRAIRAPSVLSLFRIGLPSVVAAVFACEEVAAAWSGARLEGWRAAGAWRLLQVAVATPVAEELYCRVAVLHLCANRLRSLAPACALSAVLFAAGHRAAGAAALLTRLVAGLALALRFASSGGNLAEVCTCVCIYIYIYIHIHNYILGTVCLSDDMIYPRSCSCTACTTARRWPGRPRPGDLPAPLLAP